MKERIRDIFCQKSEFLLNKRVVLAVTGSIAAIEAVKLARELIRHGATVTCVLSEAATQIISPTALEYATGVPPITQISGSVEHVELCGNHEERASLLLIAPCTANTISKIAAGIDDTAVTTFATTALGSGVPIMVAPAMHQAMFAHDIIKNNIERLRKVGVEFIMPRIVEGSAKMAAVEEIVARVLRKIGKNDLHNKSVLVITGATAEPLDCFRVVTNLSTGAMGVAIATAAYIRGGYVDLWCGLMRCSVPSWLFCSKRFSTTEQLLDIIRSANLQDYDYIFVPAAIADFAPSMVAERKKLPSAGDVSVRLRPLPKVVERIAKTYSGVLVPFKAECGVGEKELVARARALGMSIGAKYVVANRLEKVTEDKTEVIVVCGDAETKLQGTKSAVAHKIWDVVIHGRC